MIVYKLPCVCLILTYVKLTLKKKSLFFNTTYSTIYLKIFLFIVHSFGYVLIETAISNRFIYRMVSNKNYFIKMSVRGTK